MKVNQIFFGVVAALIVALISSACQRPEIIRDEVKSFYVITTPYMNSDSVFDGGELILFRAVGETAYFLDVSRGVQKRSWFVDGGDVLDKDNDQLVEGDSLIGVKYDNPGFYTVRLLATLDSTDLFYYETINDTAKDENGVVLKDANGNDSITCFNCVLQPFAAPGTLDTTFVVQVFDSLQADFSAEQEGVVGETFEAGKPVTLKDISKGTPYNYDWTIRGAEPGSSRADSVEVIWKKSGTYNITLRASRPYLEGDIRPDGDVITKTITITPSTAPLEFLSSTVDKSGDFVSVSFNQPLVALPDVSDFTLEVNGEAVTIFKLEFSDANDSSLLSLVLAEPMTPSSMYKLTSTTNILADGKNLTMPIDDGAYFKGGNNMFPAGFGDMEGLTPAGIPVVPGNTTRGLVDGLFTSGDIFSMGEPLGSQTYWKRIFPQREDMTIHTEGIADKEHVLHGNYSMKWTTGDGKQLDQHPNRGPSYDLIAGAAYKVVLWMKAEGGEGKLNVQLRKGTAGADKTANGVVVAEGEWTRVTIPYTPTVGGLHNMRLVNTAAGINYYIDEVGVYVQE